MQSPILSAFADSHPEIKGGRGKVTVLIETKLLILQKNTAAENLNGCAVISSGNSGHALVGDFYGFNFHDSAMP